VQRATLRVAVHVGDVREHLASAWRSSPCHDRHVSYERALGPRFSSRRSQLLRLSRPRPGKAFHGCAPNSHTHLRERSMSCDAAPRSRARRTASILNSRVVPLHRSPLASLESRTSMSTVSAAGQKRDQNRPNFKRRRNNRTGAMPNRLGLKAKG
jgi:hypothetical protein